MSLFPVVLERKVLFNISASLTLSSFYPLPPSLLASLCVQLCQLKATSVWISHIYTLSLSVFTIVEEENKNCAVKVTKRRLLLKQS